MKSKRHGIHSLCIRHRLWHMLLTQSLQKFLLAKTALRAGLSMQTPWKSGAIWRKWKQEDEVQQSQPVYRVEQRSSRKDSIESDCETQRRELITSWPHCDHSSSRTFSLCSCIAFFKCCDATEVRQIINAGWWSMRSPAKRRSMRGLMLRHRSLQLIIMKSLPKLNGRRTGWWSPLFPLWKWTSPSTKGQRQGRLPSWTSSLVSGSSSSLPQSTLESLPANSSGVVLRSRFSVMGSEAGYSETVEEDHSDFGMAYGIFRRWVSPLKRQGIAVYQCTACWVFFLTKAASQLEPRIVLCSRPHF